MSKHTTDFYVQIPNEYVRDDIKTKYNLSRKFYIIYILIERNSTKERISKVTMNEILEACGLDCSRKRKNTNEEIVFAINHLVQRGFVEMLNDMTKLSRTEPIIFKLNESLFYNNKSYTPITYKQFDSIINYKGSIRAENLLSVFLHIRSYIEQRPKGKVKKSFPQACYKSSANIASDVGISHTKTLECLKMLTSGERIEPIFNRKLLHCNYNTTFPLYIYVLNQPGYEREFELTKKYLHMHDINK